MKPAQKIVSAQNEKYKKWLEITEPKGIRKNKMFFLMGKKLIQEFLADRSQTTVQVSDSVTEVFTRTAATPKIKKFKSFYTYQILAEIFTEDHQRLTSAPGFQLSQKLFDELDVLGTHHNLLCLSVPEFEMFNHLSPPQGLELISPVGDPQNLGALTRSALAFNVHSIILTKESSIPFHPKAIKASAGACLKMKYFITDTLEELLAQKLESTYTLEPSGESVRQFKWPKDMYLIVGEEGPGIPVKHYFKKISVPTRAVESLNVVVATSIALHEYSSSQK